MKKEEEKKNEYHFEYSIQHIPYVYSICTVLYDKQRLGQRWAIMVWIRVQGKCRGSPKDHAHIHTLHTHQRIKIIKKNPALKRR